jgi:hypothetical protein
VGGHFAAQDEAAADQEQNAARGIECGVDYGKDGVLAERVWRNQEQKQIPRRCAPRIMRLAWWCGG